MKEERELIQRRLALMVALMQRLNKLIFSLSMRDLECEAVLKVAQENQPPITRYQLAVEPPSLRRIRNSKLLSEEIPLADFTWTDLSVLAPPEQQLFHEADLNIKMCDQILIDIKTDADLHQGVYVTEIQLLNQTHQRSLGELEEAYGQLEKKLRNLLEEHRDKFKL